MCLLISVGRGGGTSDTVGGRSLGCFFWVLPKRSIPKSDPHGKELLGTDVL